LDSFSFSGGVMSLEFVGDGVDVEDYCVCCDADCDCCSNESACGFRIENVGYSPD